MSWEAWGDDDAGQYDHLLEAGWWASEQVEDVTAAIKALVAEPIYEDGKKENGISARFLARITILRHLSGELVNSDPLVVGAEKMLAEPLTNTHEARQRATQQQQRSVDRSSEE